MNSFHNLDSRQLSPGSLPFSPSFPHMAFPGPSNVLVNLTLALKHYTQQNKGLVINQTYPPGKGFSKVFTKNEGRLDQGSRAVLLKTTTQYVYFIMFIISNISNVYYIIPQILIDSL